MYPVNIRLYTSITKLKKKKKMNNEYFYDNYFVKQDALL